GCAQHAPRRRGQGAIAPRLHPHAAGNARTRPHAARRRLRAVVRREPDHQQGDARRHRSDLLADRFQEMRRSHRTRVRRTNMPPRLRLLAAAIAVMLAPAGVMAQSFSALRGSTPLDQEGPAPAMTPEQNTAVREPRNYPEQPPVIPHSIEGYEI